MKTQAKLGLLTACILGAATVTIGAWRAAMPAEASPEETPTIKELFDLPYYAGAERDEDKHKLNLFIPDNSPDCPMLLWIHGGAWAVGSRGQETEIARRFAELGIGVAVISYRLSPGKWISPNAQEHGVQHPAHINDVARAFAWLYRNAASYGYNANNLFVGGYSAGAQLSALLATDAQYLNEQGLEIRHIKAAIPVAGAYDMEAYYQSIIGEFGREKADAHVLGVFGRSRGVLRDASPTTHISAFSAPMFVISETDTYEYTLIFERMVETLETDQITFHHVRDKDHKELYFSMQRQGNDAVRRLEKYIRRICQFDE